MMNNILSRRNRILLRELVITDFKLRYQGSVLGYAWSLLKPLFLFAIMYFVFGMLMKLGSIQHFSVYLLLGIVIWNFFAEATSQGLGSIVERGDLIRKVSLPKYIIVLSTTISALINLLLSLVIVGIFMIFNGVEVHMVALLFPFYLIEVYMLALGCAFLLSAVNVKYRDVSHIWEIIMQAAFYATPVIYTMNFVIDKSPYIAKLLLLNPMAQAIQDARYVMVTNDTITASSVYSQHSIFMYIPFLIVIVVFILGIVYFRSQSKTFAENI